MGGGLIDDATEVVAGVALGELIAVGEDAACGGLFEDVCALEGEGGGGGLVEVAAEVGEGVGAVAHGADEPAAQLCDELEGGEVLVGVDEHGCGTDVHAIGHGEPSVGAPVVEGCEGYGVGAAEAGEHDAEGGHEEVGWGDLVLLAPEVGCGGGGGGGGGEALALGGGCLGREACEGDGTEVFLEELLVLLILFALHLSLFGLGMLVEAVGMGRERLGCIGGRQVGVEEGEGEGDSVGDEVVEVVEQIVVCLGLDGLETHEGLPLQDSKRTHKTTVDVVLCVLF